MVRRLALGICLASVAAVSGCAAAVERRPVFGFFFLDEGSAAKLAYGQANSDNVGLMLRCDKGSRMVEVTDLVRSAPASRLSLISGDARSELAAEIEPGPGPSVVTAQAPTASPALAGFRRSGKIEVSYAGLRYGIAARPQERANLERFFSACERQT